MNGNHTVSTTSTAMLPELEAAIVLEQVCKQRRQHTVGPINWSIPRGYVTALVGENGTGKSTLIHMLLRTLYPDSGQISWMGETFTGELPVELRQQIAYVSELPLNEENRLTARKAAAFRAHWYPDWDMQRFEQLLDKLKVPGDVRLVKLSKGQRQKFVFAAALAASPKLLLLDEPSSGLDPFAWKEMLAALHEQMEKGELTILITTHRMEEVKRLADYVALMYEGQICGMKEKDELYQQWKEVWLGPVQDGQLLDGWQKLPGILNWEAQPDGTVRIYTSITAELQAIAAANDIPIQVRGLEWEELLSCWVNDYVIHHLQEGNA
ncbi:ABC transporter ATP-binding protein [Paenibacillus campi]|uniref:ABC transporter ATP-binding protein n=1 Tax=Paenibacillus campi TaxID=3106031 RepID=UPI002AFE21FB|nr:MULTISPECIES: ABC transporter ATP-binding protein [unclassified Paenibacillus]